MKLTVLGSGTFFAGIKQTASAFLLEADGKKILLDCGPGTLVRLSQVGVSVFDLDAVFVTHFHPDHSSDLFPLFMNFYLQELFTEKKLTHCPVFYGPEGLAKYLWDYSRLTELHVVDGFNMIKFVDVQPQQKIGKISIEAFKVLHKAFNFAARAYAYRFKYQDKVIVFSGDTAMCTGIQRACQGADLFVCDCSFPKGVKGPIHLNTEEIGRIAKEGKVKKLLLTHFYPFYETKKMVSEVKQNYSGEITTAEDLKRISI